jgi:hypothetical protein
VLFLIHFLFKPVQYTTVCTKKQIFLHISTIIFSKTTEKCHFAQNRGEKTAFMLVSAGVLRYNSAESAQPNKEDWWKEI